MQGSPLADGYRPAEPARLRAVRDLMTDIFAAENASPGSAQGAVRGRWHAPPRSPGPCPDPALDAHQHGAPPLPQAARALPQAAPAARADLPGPALTLGAAPQRPSSGGPARGELLLAARQPGGGCGGSWCFLERLLSMPSLPWDDPLALLSPRAAAADAPPAPGARDALQGVVLAAPDGPWPEAWAGRAEGGALVGCGAGAPVHPQSVARSTGCRPYGS